MMPSKVPRNTWNISFNISDFPKIVEQDKSIKKEKINLLVCNLFHFLSVSPFWNSTNSHGRGVSRGDSISQREHEMLLPRLGNAISPARLNSKRYGFQTRASVSRGKIEEMFLLRISPLVPVFEFRAQDGEAKRIVSVCHCRVNR